MKIKVLNTGATDVPWLREGIDHYMKRLKHYIPVELVFTPEIKARKAASPDYTREQEGQMIMRYLADTDMAVLLDERGKKMTSAGFSEYLQRCMNRGVRNLTFVTGGAYGFSKQVFDHVGERISLSAMTFPHQLVRLIFIEQLYRAFTILKGESYHHI
ncbi:MAG: 23S rRNA (pseudouridine(1915)-N(3))-methyltransferase RlmH [Bacteroidales bacterium]|nr:23S rRNA (pseudouridine(1915)-N(3))-methyltransferase RlmH [Bacteroidales bacterium]MBN2762928.1 23S rRNA (pseudouridine(1915)-N(3))-methyltransferase RlmH [Bacteroidales bacterium]